MDQYKINLLTLAAEYDIVDSIHWTEKLEFFISCNDIFMWGCADGEEVESQIDVELLQRALVDCDELGVDYMGPILYCARKRKLRPQGAYYSYIDKKLWHLFHECGPEREVGLGNPYAPGDYKVG